MNKNARPDVGASERAKEPGQASRQGRVSTSHDTTVGPQGQAVKIADFLNHGEDHAIPMCHLRELLHLPARTIRLMIRRERLSGVCILEDSRTGYFLPANDRERDLCAKRLRHRAAEIARVAEAIAAADISGGGA